MPGRKRVKVSFNRTNQLSNLTITPNEMFKRFEEEFKGLEQDEIAERFQMVYNKYKNIINKFPLTEQWRFESESWY